MNSTAPLALRQVRWPAWLVLSVFLAPVLAGLLLPAVEQPEQYHQFADSRTCFGIANCLDVLSNLPFTVLGAAGLVLLLRAGASQLFIEARERWSYVVFFAGALLVGLGSAYYHLAPDGMRLVWDRLPMSMMFMSLLAATLSERVDIRLGMRWLAPLVLMGIASVLYWRWSMLQGGNDLLPYGVVQYGGIAAIFALALRPSRYTRAGDVFVLGLCYGLAKAGEVFDQQIFALSGFVSGHTLKHLCAALAVYWVMRSLRLRQPLGAVQAYTTL